MFCKISAYFGIDKVNYHTPKSEKATNVTASKIAFTLAVKTRI